MPSGVIFALAPSSSLGVQFESGLYLVCLGNFFGVWAWPQRPCVLACEAPLCGVAAPPSRPVRSLSAPAAALAGRRHCGSDLSFVCQILCVSVNILEFRSRLG